METLKEEKVLQCKFNYKLWDSHCCWRLYFNELSGV